MIIFTLTLRQLMSGKRWLVLLALAAFPLALSLAERTWSDEPVFLQDAYQGLVVGVIVPIIALLLAGSTFANDIEEGTAVFLLAKPVARLRILLERYGAAALLGAGVALFAAGSAVAVQSGRLENLGSFLTAQIVASAFGAALYSAFFIMLSLVTRRAIVAGLLYVLIWESTLAGQFAGTRALSVKEYMLAVAASIDKSGLAQGATNMTASTALISGVVLLLLTLLISWYRLRDFEFREKP